MTKPAIGAHEQMRVHMPMLAELSRNAAKLQKYINSGAEIGDPIEELYSHGIMHGSHLTFEIYNGRDVLALEDDPHNFLEITHSGEYHNLDMICHNLMLSKKQINGEEDLPTDSLLADIAARHEQMARKATNIVETDGLTCWLLALEGARQLDVDRDAMLTEIRSALNKRRLPRGEAATYISQGWQRRQTSLRLGRSPNTVDWDHDGIHRSALARITFKPEQVYEGPAITSDIIFARRFEIIGKQIHVEAEIPDAAFQALQGMPIEKVIDDDRLHGWNLKVSGAKRTDEPNTGLPPRLYLDTNRDDPECRMCFANLAVF